MRVLAGEARNELEGLRTDRRSSGVKRQDLRCCVEDSPTESPSAPLKWSTKGHLPSIEGPASASGQTSVHTMRRCEHTASSVVATTSRTETCLRVAAKTAGNTSTGAAVGAPSEATGGTV